MTNKLPTEERVREPGRVESWPMEDLSREYRLEADRERDCWYMTAEVFAAWMKAMGEKYDRRR